MRLMSSTFSRSAWNSGADPAFFGRRARLLLRRAIVNRDAIAGLIQPQRDRAADALGRAVD